LEGHSREVHAVAYSADGKRALSGGNDRTVRLWNIEDGKELQRFTGHRNAVIAVAFGPEERILSASSQYQTADRVLRVWDAKKGREEKAYGGSETDRVRCAAFAADGGIALSAGADSALRLWILKPDKK
jgi:WD40 repeat protein